MYVMTGYFNNTMLPATRTHAETWTPSDPVRLFTGYGKGDELVRSQSSHTWHPGGQQGKWTRDEEYERAAENAFMVMNRDDRSNHDERSLSVGDVVLVSGPDGVRWYSCAMIGFERIEEPYGYGD